MAKRGSGPPEANLEAIEAGWRSLDRHPLFGHLLRLVALSTEPKRPFPGDGYARLIVSPSYLWQGGRQEPAWLVTAELNPYRRATPEEWAHVLAQLLLHTALNHVDPVRTDAPWRWACELEALEMLRHLSVGLRPVDLAPLPEALPVKGTEAIARLIRDGGLEAERLYGRCGTAGLGEPTWDTDRSVEPFSETWRKRQEAAFAAGLRHAITQAVEQAGDTARGPGNARRNPNSMAEKARSWFVSNYPLLASLAAAFEIVEDAALCERYDITVAAVDSEQRIVYVNPKFPWTVPAMQFVIAHELLHVGLRHEARRQGRDPFLWNVACDYVINGWLLEMGVGALPTDDLLLDPELAFERESAEAIYDRIVRDLRLMRRLAKQRTLRGVGKVDIIGDRPAGWWSGPGCDLDGFYRRALAEGLEIHVAAAGRGLLPGDLVEEIRALQQPPIPWDVELGQWLDHFFPPVERRRTYARASRRQSATPDIPRPVWERPLERHFMRTFGVVLDTSGSMPPRLLAKALGAMASYAMSRDVAFLRVMQCDAGVHDMGWVAPEMLARTVEIRGRGGTVLQPAIQRLERADDFPADAPILVITDGRCDALTLSRDHAFLMPEGARLPFRSTAPRFAFEAD